MSAVEVQVEAATDSEGPVRYVVESLICLALAVMLVRAFAVEGYIISTGSMAPYLLGYHQQVVCPECRFPFAVGMLVDEPADPDVLVECPNCRQRQIDLSRVPRNEGDQLLVQKFAFQLRRPRRWEVVVFQNPSRPTQAYVKRVVGLPGESIQIRAGDVWINGELARKSLADQRSTRIVVCDHTHRPGQRHEFAWHAEAGWSESTDGFEHSYSPSSTSESLNWVNYVGATGDSSAARSDDSAESRWPTDEYAYNQYVEATPRYRVRDVMLVMQVELHSGRGDLVWSLSDGHQTWQVKLAAGERELQLLLDDSPKPVERAKLSGQVWQQKRLVEMSLFDRQLLFAIDGDVIFCRTLEPLPPLVKHSDGTANSSPVQAVPARFGARDLRVSVTRLTLYRDVYYTRGEGRHGVTEPYLLGPDEYFFLGDNSPVSLDSRSWPDAVVRDPMLIGKPFLVHLPSRPGRIKLGPAEWNIRVPDWKRMRYIR
jgi:signal peptidase I